MTKINLSNIWNYFVFQLKVLLKNKWIYCFFLIPLLFIFTTMTIGTLEIFYIGVFSGTFLISTLFIYKLFYYDKDTIKKLHISKTEQHISIIGIVLFFNFFLFFSIIFYFFFFSNILGILNLNEFFFFLPKTFTFKIKSINWGISFYYLFFFSLMAYFFNFFLSSFFKKDKTFFIFSTSYIILTIFFGGVISTIFAYKIDISSSTFASGSIYVQPVMKTDFLNYNYYLSNLFSFFFLNQFVYLMFINVNFVFPETNHALIINFDFFKFYNLYWDLLIIMPYVWILFYFLIGTYVNKLNEE